MQYHGRWDWQQAYNLPAGLRDWYGEQLTNQLEAEQKAQEDAAKKARGKK